MATQNGLNTSLSGQTGTGNFAGSNSPTLVTPSIDQINDTNGNAALAFTGQSSAVNYIASFNSATGVPLGFAAVGNDPNIQFNINSKGTGAVALITGAPTVPLGIYSGTSAQHLTQFSMPNTAAVRTVTFQDSDGTMAYLADRGYVLLGTATASSSAFIAFTNLTGYTNYMVVYNALTPVNNGVVLYFQGSIDNGINWLFTPPAYYQQSLFVTNTTVAAGSDVTTLVAGVLSSTILNSVPGPSGWLLFQGLGSGTRKGYTGQTIYVNSATSTLGAVYPTGWFANTNAINAIRLIMSVGNISSGTVSIYGMK